MITTAVVGVVGNDVPRQLPLAAGVLPVRLTGSWDGPVDPQAQDLLGAADLEAVRILTELRAGAAPRDGVIVCNDSQAHLRLFYVLRATAPHLPLHLLDLPRQDSAPAREFARGRLKGLLEFCEEVSGSAVSVASLAEAAESERALGAELDRLRRVRRTDPSGCTGTVAIDAWLQAGRLPPADAAMVVAAACASADQDGARRPALRVHLTGSNHPDASVYRELEAHGLVIVSEDHDTGDGAWIGVAGSGDAGQVVDELVTAHFARVGGAATELSARRADETVRVSRQAGADVVGAFIRDLDDAPRWDLADQTRALETIGLDLHARVGVGTDAHAAATELAGALRGGRDR